MAPAQDLHHCIQNEAEQKQKKGAITECLVDTKLNRKTLFSPIDKNKKDQTAYPPAPQLQKKKRYYSKMNYLLLNEIETDLNWFSPHSSMSCIKALAFLQLNHIRCHINGPL